MYAERFAGSVCLDDFPTSPLRRQKESGGLMVAAALLFCPCWTALNYKLICCTASLQSE